MKSTHKYFPVNDAQRAWGLYATCAGRSETEPGDEFPSAVHPDEYFFTWEKGRVLHEWQLSLIEQGRGTVEFQDRRYVAKKGSLIILPPGCWHRYRPNKSTGWTTLWIGFGGDLADRMIGGAGLNPKGEVRDMSHARQFHHIMSKTVTDILEHRIDNLYSTVAHIPLLIASLIDNPSPDANILSRATLIHRAQAHIVDHATQIIDFQALAESLGIPYRTFRYQFAKATGPSPLQYQLEIRLARAKNLLRSSDMPVAEIARALGFKSTWYFAHFFRQRVRASPSAYRKRQKG